MPPSLLIGQHLRPKTCGNSDQSDRAGRSGCQPAGSSEAKHRLTNVPLFQNRGLASARRLAERITPALVRGVQLTKDLADLLRFERFMLQFMFEQFQFLANQFSLHPLVRSYFAFA